MKGHTVEKRAVNKWCCHNCSARPRRGNATSPEADPECITDLSIKLKIENFLEDETTENPDDLGSDKSLSAILPVICERKHQCHLKNSKIKKKSLHVVCVGEH